jgi:glycolate oxidase FAD binding subunit
VLRAEYQRLPVDVPRADRATLGGAIACNLSGPRRYGFGTLRDYLIGISVVDAAGREVKGGGRVVKNVAGYDLCKLYTGSLGTLGIISQVTLKLRPLPEASALSWIVPPDAARLRAVLDRLAGSATRPVAIDLLSPRAAAQIAGQARQPLGTAPYVVVVGFEENAEAVAWQQAKLRDELSDTNSEITAIPDADAEWLWRALTAFQAVELGPVTFKANLLSSASVDLLDLVQRQPVECAVQLHAGSGVAYIHACGEPEMADVQRTAHALRECAVERRGNLVVRRSPAEWKSRLLVWGKPRGDAPLMAEVKRSLDPKGLLNPHRFVGD